MNLLKRAGIAALPLALCGCLEVNQHPAWIDGGYAGKIDQLPYQQHFHRDRLAWFAAITNRNLYQNEYVRAKPPGMAGAKRLQDIGATPQQNTGQGSSGAGPAPAGAAATAPARGAPAATAGGMVQPGPGAASPAAAGATRQPGSR